MAKPKILLYDIETAPILGYTWALFDQNVIAVERDWYILAFAYKWLGEDQVRSFGLPDYPGYKPEAHDDEKLCVDLHRVLDEADVVIGHNLDAFDNKKSNARFVYHGMKPPSPSKTIDTLKLAKKHFKFDSNRLNSLGQFLGVGQKAPTGGFELWKGCMSGDPESWVKMKKYNTQDVVLLERVYEQLRPWATALPDLSGHLGNHACPSCSGNRLQRRGTTISRTRKYQRFQCQDCGHWSKGEIIKVNTE